MRSHNSALHAGLKNSEYFYIENGMVIRRLPTALDLCELISVVRTETVSENLNYTV